MPVNLRRATGWLIRPFFRRKYEVNQTSDRIAEELWLALRHPAEVPSVGLRLLELHQPGKVTTSSSTLILSEFRAFCRQAENFYRGAEVLPWRSSPLNYYYSFLNLAKAYALLSGAMPPPTSSAACPGVESTPQTTTPRRIRHGITERVLYGNPDLWHLTSGTTADVFPLLYRLCIGKELPEKTTFEGHDLLGYSLPVGWQLAESGHSHRIASFQCRWVVCTTPEEVWDVVAIPSSIDDSALGKPFEVAYERVAFDGVKRFAREWWGMDGLNASHYGFFQRREPYKATQSGDWNVDDLQAGFESALEGRAYEMLSRHDAEFLLCLPCATASGRHCQMNQEVASYAVMFFLSSLVRYHPDYMDSIAQQSDAWLVESFVKTAPLELLRSMTAKILGYTILMTSA